MNGQDVVIAARTLIGTPWQDRGRSSKGLDCAGLLLAIGEQLELPVKMLDQFSDHNATYRLLHQNLLTICIELDDEDMPKAGDIVTYSFAGDLHAHAAIETGEGTIIHAYSPASGVCEHPKVGKWKRVHRRFRLEAVIG